MNRRLSLLAFALATCFCAAGCDLFQQRTTDTTQSPVVDAPSTDFHGQFNDVPVPHGFKYNRDLSFVYTGKAMRSASLLYTGQQKVYEVVDFFERNMPALGWTRHSVERKDFVSKMRFVKGYDECNITILSRNDTTDLMVDIGPKRN